MRSGAGSVRLRGPVHMLQVHGLDATVTVTTVCPENCLYLPDFQKPPNWHSGSYQAPRTGEAEGAITNFQEWGNKGEGEEKG